MRKQKCAKIERTSAKASSSKIKAVYSKAHSPFVVFNHSKNRFSNGMWCHVLWWVIEGVAFHEYECCIGSRSFSSKLGSDCKGHKKTYHISKWYNIFSCSSFSSPKICIGRSAVFTVKVTCNHFKAIAIVHFSNLVLVQFLELVQLVQLVQLVHVLETGVPFTGYEARNNFQILRYTDSQYICSLKVLASIYIERRLWQVKYLCYLHDFESPCTYVGIEQVYLLLM